MDNDSYIQRIHILLQDLNDYPELLNGVLDETTRQQTIADMGDIMTQLAQVDDGESLLAVVQRIDTMLRERGIMAVLTKQPPDPPVAVLTAEPPSATNDRLTEAQLQRMRERDKAADSALREQQKKLIENILPQIGQILETTLPKQDKNVS
jgi:hypothetical protein